MYIGGNSELSEILQPQPQTYRQLRAAASAFKGVCVCARACVPLPFHFSQALAAALLSNPPSVTLTSPHHYHHRFYSTQRCEQTQTHTNCVIPRELSTTPHVTSLSFSSFYSLLKGTFTLTDGGIEKGRDLKRRRPAYWTVAATLTWGLCRSRYARL